MDNNRSRALKALGIKKLERMREDEERALLIGLLFLELDRLTGRDFCYYAKDTFGGSEQVIHTESRRINCKSESILEALVLAVEAAQEGK